jgi:methylglyoxal synthase
MKPKVIALVAHDRKKTDIVVWANFNRGKLEKCSLIGTGTTAKIVNEKTGLKVEVLLSGPSGGDAQIAARVAEGKIDAVIFLRDPLGKHPHDPDINTLMRVCDVHNIPLATNLATADLIITAFEVERIEQE